MAIPDFQTLMLPVLKTAAGGGEVRIGDVVDQLADVFALTASAVTTKHRVPSITRTSSVFIWQISLSRMPENKPINGTQKHPRRGRASPGLAQP